MSTTPTRQSGLLLDVYAAVLALPRSGSASIRVLQPGQIFRALAGPPVPSGRRDIAVGWV